MKAILAFFTLASLVLAACGANGNASDEEAIRDVVDDFASAYNRGDANTLYNLIDSISQGACSRDDFVTAVEQARSMTSNAQLRIETVDEIIVEGSAASAFIVTTFANETSEPALETFLKEDGSWKLVGSFC